MLPGGYDANVCKAEHPPDTGALATVECGASSAAGGPTAARYSLFADQQTLDQRFQEGLKLFDVLGKCPGNDLDSPVTWHFTETPDKVEGQVACGTYEGNGDVYWTHNANLLIGDAIGPNLEELHKWWLDNG